MNDPKKILTQIVTIDPKKDLPQVLEIEQASFSIQWTLEDFIRAFRLREVVGVKLEIIERSSFWSWCSKTQTKRKLVGFLLFCRISTSVLEIWNMAVDPKFHRMGYGTILIEHLKQRLSRVPHRKKICTLISEYNLVGQLFFQSCGFRCEKIVRQYWDVPDTKNMDAYSMEYHKLFVPRNRLQFGGFVDVVDI